MPDGEHADSAIVATTHAVTRLSIDTGQPYEQFRARYEASVPPWPAELVAGLVASGSSWDDVVAQAAATAPHGLFTYWRSESAPLMRLAGDHWECTSYLIGNTIIAERMFRRDPTVMSVLPFHSTITAGPDGATRLTFDRPSSHLTSFADGAFAELATRVDERFADLLRALGSPVPTQLAPAVS